MCARPNRAVEERSQTASRTPKDQPLGGHDRPPLRCPRPPPHPPRQLGPSPLGRDIATSPRCDHRRPPRDGLTTDAHTHATRHAPWRWRAPTRGAAPRPRGRRRSRRWTCDARHERIRALTIAQRVVSAGGRHARLRRTAASNTHTAHTRTHTYTHTHTDTHTHAHAHTNAHTHTRAHARTHTNIMTPMTTRLNG